MSSNTSVLGKKLTFGDTEQIRALKLLEVAAAKREWEKKEIAEGRLHRYEVEIHWEGESIVKVVAADKENAKRIAEEIGGDPDMEIDYMIVTES